jgi:hypothetical protein
MDIGPEDEPLLRLGSGSGIVVRHILFRFFLI